MVTDEQQFRPRRVCLGGELVEGQGAGQGGFVDDQQLARVQAEPAINLSDLVDVPAEFGDPLGVAGGRGYRAFGACRSSRR